MSRDVKILVADDDAVTRNMVADKLSESGYLVRSVDDGLAAVAALQEGEFDVVVTDIMMPDITGQGVLEAVRREMPDTEVIIITGFGNVDMAFECLRSGAFDFIEKPFKLQVLVDTVRRALDRRNARLACRGVDGASPGVDLTRVESWMRDFKELWWNMDEIRRRADRMISELERILPSKPAAGDEHVKEADSRSGEGDLLTAYDKRPRERTDDVLELLRKDPGNRKIKEWLAFEYYRNGKTEQAIRCYRELLELAPSDSVARYYLANCYFKKGRVEEAMAEWRKVMELAPSSPIASKSRRRLEACRLGSGPGRECSKG